MAIDHLLHMHVVRGSSVEAIVGHFTWSTLVRREVLSVLCATFELLESTELVVLLCGHL